MIQYGWNDCPLAVKRQVQGFITDLVNLLANNLIGMYVHGSLAMACFNPRHSDLDLLVVTKEHLALDTKRHLAELLLRRSRAPQPIEMSVLAHSDLIPWQYPTPFAFHYSEMWRDQMQHDVASGNWQHWNDKIRKDPDLAAHITITKHRGICVYGKPIPNIFPDVPPDDYLASIIEDITGALATIEDDPVYAVLNTCRVWAFLQAGLIYSKQEGGKWALARVPDNIRPVVATALQVYSNEQESAHFDTDSLAAFITYMHEQLP